MKVFTNVTFDQHQIHSAAPPCSGFYSRTLNAMSFESCRSEIPKGNLGLNHSDSVIDVNPFIALDQALETDLTLIVLWKVSIDKL